jgi:hypothetical protein
MPDFLCNVGYELKKSRDDRWWFWHDFDLGDVEMDDESCLIGGLISMSALEPFCWVAGR